MNTIRIRRAETLPLSLTTDQDGASTATLIVKLDEHDALPVITKTVSFSGRTADLTLSSLETAIESTTYIYQITVVYSDGSVGKYPDAGSGCADDTCGFPEFIVCEALDSYEVS